MKTPCYGNYRAKVVSSKDPLRHGRIRVWIPDLMPEIDDDQGIWALSANNPIGGRNFGGDSDHYFAGSCLIPPTGSWVWIFFECGDVSRPVYFAACDLTNTKVLPENQVGLHPEKKWTLLKTPEGRTIILSDDPFDARVEITGKKRLMLIPPTGDLLSVYTIESNQNTILLDERFGLEKLLIKTWKGDYLKINIGEGKLEASFSGGMQIECGKGIKIGTRASINTVSRGIRMVAKNNISLTSYMGDILIQSMVGSFIVQAFQIVQTGMFSILNRSLGMLTNEALVNVTNKAGGLVSNEAEIMVTNKAMAIISNDAPIKLDNSGASLPVLPSPVIPKLPKLPNIPLPFGWRDLP